MSFSFCFIIDGKNVFLHIQKIVDELQRIEKHVQFSHSFDPPGQMSAGLTCEMLVTFKPMVKTNKIDFVIILNIITAV